MQQYTLQTDNSHKIYLLVEELTEPAVGSILHGNTILNTEENEKVFRAVHVYILSTFFLKGFTGLGIFTSAPHQPLYCFLSEKPIIQACIAEVLTTVCGHLAIVLIEYRLNQIYLVQFHMLSAILDNTACL